jgi:hypothetical protein
MQLYCRCFTVLHLVVAALHYMFRPTWPSSGVYEVYDDDVYDVEQNSETSKIKLHADGNITSKPIEKYVHMLHKPFHNCF